MYARSQILYSSRQSVFVPRTESQNVRQNKKSSSNERDENRCELALKVNILSATVFGKVSFS